MAIINGTNTANTLNGGAENDSISGLAGNDTINGGAGNDTINGGPGIDVMTGGAGADVFVFANGDGGNVEPHDRITDFQVGTDRLQLPGAIIGTQAVSNGTYVNYAGGDTYNWILLDGVVNPNLAQLTNPGASPPPPPPPTGGPTTGNDNLTGTSGNDSISGLAGNDTINGGAGNDTINGGPGIDVMTGGAGADVFVFASGDCGNVEPHDRITDFQVGTDRLQLPGAIIGTQAASNGTYVNYAGGDTYNWILLDGVVNPNLAQLTN